MECDYNFDDSLFEKREKAEKVTAQTAFKANVCEPQVCHYQTSPIRHTCNNIKLTDCITIRHILKAYWIFFV